MHFPTESGGRYLRRLRPASVTQLIPVLLIAQGVYFAFTPRWGVYLCVSLIGERLIGAQ